MRSWLSRVGATIVVGLLVVSCAPAPSPAPVTSAPQTERPASSSPLAATPPPTASPMGPAIMAIAAGADHTCALMSGGRVKCWGANSAGQVGNGAVTEVATTPVDVSGLAGGVTAIATGDSQTCALTTGGGVKCWGANSFGKLGSGTNADSLVPVPVDVSGLGSGATAIAAGGGHTCALTSGGEVKCWGANNGGQLGNGTTTDSNVPVDVSGLAIGIRAISAGGLHTCALTSGGGINCWGFNEDGQLGNGSTTSSSSIPLDVSGLGSGVVAIAAGGLHACALTSGGGVKCWGWNRSGELGNGTTTDSRIPVDVSGLTSGVSAIAAGGDHTCALIIGGGVKCWGSNWAGQLGDGTTRHSGTPVEVSGLAHGVSAIAVGAYHTCVLISGDRVKCWGDNSAGQLGDGSMTQSQVPVEIYVRAPSVIDEPPASVSAAFPVRASARAVGERVQLAPGPGGSLFVSIPASGGSVLLAMLDSTGRPRLGWPVLLEGATSCRQLFPVDDGSVRLVCAPADLGDKLVSGVRAFAFDAMGGLLPAWPIDLHIYALSERVIGDTLTAYVPDSGLIVTVAADGTIRNGAQVPIDCCYISAVGPDEIAYTVVHHYANTPAGTTSELLAVGFGGVPAGWPVSFDGLASEPAFGPDGRIVLTVASIGRNTSRVLAFDGHGEVVAARSPELPIATGVVVFSDGSYECGQPRPRPPLIAQDGTMFVYSELDTSVYALDSSLATIRGWPFEPATPLVRRDPGPRGVGIDCTSLAVPAVGSDATLYLPLQARGTTVGGSIVAVGPDGRVRPGWPLELRRPGAEFWSVVVGSDGTVYALAIEPEPGGASSASILAIAPDSTVLYTTTIIDP